VSDKSKKGNWTVKIRAEVDKEVTCENCTEEEARNDPWEHAVDEIEIMQSSWEVKSVNPTD